VRARIGAVRLALAGAGIALGLLLGGCGPSSTGTPGTPLAGTGSASMAGPATLSGATNVSDLEVTNHVQSALNQDDSLKGFNLSVVTLKGDVRLGGVLDTQAQIDSALRIARAADGAHSIHDELTLKAR
jgi:hypothetical protein